MKKARPTDLAFKIRFCVRLIVRRSSIWKYVDTMTALVENNLAVHKREKGPIAAGADILARHELRPALTDENAACSDMFAAEAFHAQAFADAIASVTNTALTFLMCHTYALISLIFNTVSS